MKNKEFYNIVRSKGDEYAHLIYSLTKNFPREELYGLTSQLRRSALSVVLNFIEGYARSKSQIKDKSFGYFLDVSYGSLQESKYLLEFSKVEG